MSKYLNHNAEVDVQDLTFEDAKDYLSSGEFAKTADVMAKKFQNKALDLMYTLMHKPIKHSANLFVRLMLEQLQYITGL